MNCKSLSILILFFTVLSSCQRPNNTDELNKMLGNEPLPKPATQAVNPCDVVNQYITMVDAYMRAVENYENGMSASLPDAIAQMILIQQAATTLQNFGNDAHQLECWDDYTEYVSRLAEASSLVAADAEYIRLLNAANTEAANMMREANSQANQMMQEANRQADQMMQDADGEANRMMRDAEREADQMMREAEINSSSDY